MNQTHLTHPDKQAKMVFAKRFVFVMFTLPNISKKSSSPVIFQEKKLEIDNFFDNPKLTNTAQSFATETEK